MKTALLLNSRFVSAHSHRSADLPGNGPLGSSSGKQAIPVVGEMAMFNSYQRQWPVQR